MSALLLSAAVAFVREAFTRQEVADVRPYAGEFNSVEMDKLSYTCPAILITVLGWEPKPSGGRITGKGTNEARLGAFVATKSAKTREARMDEAMRLAERLSLLLLHWQPDDDALPIHIGSIEEDGARCENLYSRAIDDKGQALWLVSWQQCARLKPGVPADQLFDLLRVEITDTTQQGQAPAAPAPAPGTLIVTEDVKFKTPL